MGWQWLDPLMGIVGSLVITRWAYGLLKDTSTILLDRNTEKEHVELIRQRIESDSDNIVSDIHIWRVGPVDYAAIISLVTHYPKSTEHYKNLLAEFKELSHLTIEVNSCIGDPCIVP